MNKLMSLKDKLIKKEKILGTTISAIEFSGILQKMNNETLDFVLFDFEHGILNAENSEEMLRICRMLDLPAIVRVQDTVPNLISKAIDMGADGIMLPRVETIEQVETAVQSMRFFPRGKKGCGGFSLFRQGEKFEEINDNRLLFLQIESMSGIKKLDMILEKWKKEIAGIIVGPYDMSIISGVPLEIKCDKMLLQISELTAVCQKHNISCGIFCDGASDMPFWYAEGFNIMWCSSELALLMKAYNEMCQEFKKL